MASSKINQVHIWTIYNTVLQKKKCIFRDNLELIGCCWFFNRGTTSFAKPAYAGCAA